MAVSGRMQEAIETTDAYFEGFPHMNFPYDARVLPHINVYIRAQAMDKAKHHMRILATELADNMEFFNSLDDDDLKAGFNLDWRLSTNAIAEILKVSKTINDDAFAQEMESIVGPYNPTTPPE